MWSIHPCPTMHRWCKFGENVSNTLQDIVITMFQDACTDEQTKPWCVRAHYVWQRHKKKEETGDSQRITRFLLVAVQSTSELLPSSTTSESSTMYTHKLDHCNGLFTCLPAMNSVARQWSRDKLCHPAPARCRKQLSHARPAPASMGPATVPLPYICVPIPSRSRRQS